MAAANDFVKGIGGRLKSMPIVSMRKEDGWVGVTRHQSACMYQPLGWMGRHSLVLYLLHQPVILGVLTVAFRLVRAG